MVLMCARFSNISKDEKTELGQALIRSLKQAVAGETKVITCAKDLEDWIEVELDEERYYTQG